MTYYVSSGTLNSTNSTQLLCKYNTNWWKCWVGGVRIPSPDEWDPWKFGEFYSGMDGIAMENPYAVRFDSVYKGQ